MTVDSLPLPSWQVTILLVAFPVSYLVHNFTPWAEQLWRGCDRTKFLTFWSGVTVIHWASTGVVVWVVSSHGYTLADIGLVVPDSTLLLSITGVVTIGASMLYVFQVIRTKSIPVDSIQMPTPGTTTPATQTERYFFFFTSIVSASFCEEIVYRGFAILALVGTGVPVWLAVCLASFTFVFVHGLAPIVAPRLFLGYFLIGGVFAALFLYTGTLLVPIVVHGAFNIFVSVRSTRSSLDTMQSSSVASN